MIWLIGNNGMLGREMAQMLTKLGFDYTGTDREVDITSPDSLRDFAAGKKESGHTIDWIINCAAYTAVDKAEDEQEICRRINEVGPANIAAAARSIGAKFLHISTDYVFNGNASRPYCEDDPTDPIGIYGLTKRNGEVAALEKCPDTWIIRTAWLYGRFGNNFVHTMLRLMASKDKLSVVADQRGSPTYAPDLCRALCAVISSDGTINPGIYHFSNQGETTWFDFAREIQRLGKVFGHIQTDCIVSPCTSGEYPAKVTRPLYSVLDKKKIQNVLGYTIPAWQDSLHDYLKEYVCVH